MNFKRIIAVTLFMLTARVATATAYYVDGTRGSDGNTCAQSQNVGTAKASITAGIACIGAGDILYVRSGNYHESVFLTIPSGAAGSPTTIQGYPGDTAPTMVAGNLTLALENYITWNGVNIDGSGDSNDIDDCVLINSGHDITITHADLANCQRHGVNINDGNGANLSNITLSYLTVHNSGQGYLTSGDPRHHNFYISAHNFTTGPIVLDHIESYQSNNPADSDTNAKNSWGIQIYSTTPGFLNGVVVSNSYVHDNNQGIVVGSGTGHKVYNTVVANNRESNNEAAITVSYGSPNNIQVYNNTIVGNGDYCLETGAFSTPTNTVFENNICYGNTAGDSIHNYASTNTISSNNLFGTNPLFVSSTDFHLTSTSPARNAGLNLSSIFNTDKDGNSRPSSGVWDAGAYQTAGSVSVPPAPQNLHLLP